MATERKRTGPPVDVLVAVLTVDGDSLAVLQTRRDGERGWSLPGTSLRGGDRLADAVARSLSATGLSGVSARQLHVLDDPDGLTVAYVAVVGADAVSARSASTRLAPALSPGRLPAGQGTVVSLAVAHARSRYAAAPDPDGLLGASFTILDLRRVHEAVAGAPLQKDTFRRAMEAHLSGTGTSAPGLRGRPAELFRRA